jgi:hypothetical protein
MQTRMTRNAEDKNARKDAMLINESIIAAMDDQYTAEHLEEYCRSVTRVECLSEIDCCGSDEGIGCKITLSNGNSYTVYINRVH